MLALLMLFVAACSLGRSASPDEDGSTGVGLGYRQARELAPIESVEIVVAESFPQQYFAHIVSGLPSGCASFDELTTDRSGDAIEIAVWNLVPAPGELVACTAIYGYVEHNVPLGTDFTSGERYRLVVNGVEETFTAQ